MFGKIVFYFENLYLPSPSVSLTSQPCIPSPEVASKPEGPVASARVVQLWEGFRKKGRRFVLLVIMYFFSLEMHRK